MELLKSIKSPLENVYKLVYQNSIAPLEVSVIRKGDGKDILCVPCQTSCKMGCSFCFLTAMSLPTQNLTAQEIVDLVKSSLQYSPPQNPTLLISYMGAGEPLMNVEAIINSAKEISNFNNYQTIRFAISSMIPGKRPFYQFLEAVKSNNLNFKLHWSMHSTNNSKRKSLMPSALNLEDSLSLIKEYIDQTNLPAEIHYTLMNGVNDTEQDIENITKLVDPRINFKILKYANNKNQPDLSISNYTNEFKLKLIQRGYTVETYSPPGEAIGSSCGMFLADQYIS